MRNSQMNKIIMIMIINLKKNEDVVVVAFDQLLVTSLVNKFATFCAS